VAQFAASGAERHADCKRGGRRVRGRWLAPLVAGALALASPAAAAPKHLSLTEAMAKARKNPLALAAIQRTRAAAAQADEARGSRWPRLVVTSFVAPSPDVHCEDAACTRTDPKDATLAAHGVFGGVRVELFQPLYTFGKLDSAIDAAVSATRVNEALADGVARDLGLDAARAYLGVELSRDLFGMLEEGGRRIASAREKLTERLAQGDPEVTVQDRLRLETFAAEVRSRLSEAREGEATALSALRALVGERDADTDGPFEALSFEPSEVKSYLDRAEAGRPELRAARAGVSALEGLKRLEDARWLPDLLLMGGFNWARAQGVDEPPSAFANDPFNTTTAQAALVLRWTLDPVAQAARVARADAEVERGRQILNAAGRATMFAVEQAHTRAVEAHARLEAAREGERSARGWVLSVVQADAIGTTQAKDLADAYLAYFTLHGRVAQSIYDWNLAVVALRAAIGESSLPPAHP
jgi:outer membrane protein TolC